MPINSATIDDLIRVLNSLKRDGQNDKRPFRTGDENEMDLFSKRSALAKAKRMRDALRVLSLHAEHEVQEIEKVVFPEVLQHGIRGLPNELLARIFEFACEELAFGDGTGLPPSECAITLSQVSTRYRAIALDTPCLWSYISDILLHKGMLEAFLSRSKNRSLTIEITLDRPRTLIEFLSAIKLHSNRWIKLLVHTQHFSNYVVIRKAFGCEPLDCPILESIVVSGSPVVINGGFALHWNMPALKHWSSVDWCPTPFPNSHLTSLEYECSSLWDCVPDKLQVFINATDSLRDLKLVIYYTPTKRTIVPPYLPAHFPQLIKLSLCFGPATEEDRVADVMRTLHLPNLEELSVELNSIKAQGLKMDRDIRALLPFHDKFPRLKDFRLSIQDELGSRYPFDLSPMFSLLPTLHNLILELPNIRPDFGVRVRGNADIHNGPTLRSLRLIKCHLLTDKFIEDALPMIRGGTGEDAFSLLEITDCENISRNRVEAMLCPEEKLLWS